MLLRFSLMLVDAGNKKKPGDPVMYKNKKWQWLVSNHHRAFDTAMALALNTVRNTDKC